MIATPTPGADDRDDAAAAPTAAGAPRPGRARALLQRVPLWAGGLVALVLLSGADRTPSLRDAATLQAVTDARLVRPAAYALLAPVTGVYDALTLLTQRQHYWLLSTLALLWALWRLLRAPTGPRRSLPRRALRAAGLAAAALGAFLAVYAVGALVPRPMARLVVDDPDVVIVDFHTHTGSSWDTWKAFTRERRSRWHAAAGFDALFVTDHAAFGGHAAADGSSPDPDGPRLLPAVEVRHHWQHIVMIGDSATHQPLVTNGHVDSASVDALRAAGAPEPLVLLTLPARLDKLPTGGPGALRIGGVEISDASPKGLEFAHRHREALVALADSLDVPLLAGTNHHGWGSTVAAWNLVRVPGWRAMPADTLAARIAEVVRRDGRRSVRVVERNQPRPDTPVALAATMPSAVWGLFATLSWGERLGWLAWTALLAGLSLRRARVS
jgi:hypothetical protein